MAIIGFHNVSVLAPDSSSTIDFYHRLGFETDRTERDDLRHITTFTLTGPGGSVIEVVQPTGKDVPFKGGVKHITFYSDNLKEDLETFTKNGVSILGKKFQYKEDQESFFAKSPTGEFVRIVQKKQ